MSTLAWLFTTIGVVVVAIVGLSLLDWLAARKLAAARRALDMQGKRRVGL